MEERDIGSGLDREMQIGRCGSRGRARIDDNDPDRRIARLRGFDAAIQNRMRPRGVRSGDEKTARVIDIVVARGRRIGAKRRLVTGDGARHAEPRIRVDVVGADESLGELVEDVIVLGQELTGNVERDAVGAVVANARREAIGQRSERDVP